MIKKALYTAIMASVFISSSYAAPLTSQTKQINAPTIQAAQQQKHRYLFVLSASTANIRKTAAGFTLTLTQVDPQVLWFTDHPARRSGMVATKEFIAQWKTLYSQSSEPNAAIVHAGVKANVNGEVQAESMELLNPIFLPNGILQFQIKALSGDHFQAGSMKDISLFIDSSHYAAINLA